MDDRSGARPHRRVLRAHREGHLARRGVSANAFALRRPAPSPGGARSASDARAAAITTSAAAGCASRTPGPSTPSDSANWLTRSSSSSHGDVVDVRSPGRQRLELVHDAHLLQVRAEPVGQPVEPAGPRRAGSAAGRRAGRRPRASRSRAGTRRSSWRSTSARTSRNCAPRSPSRRQAHVARGVEHGDHRLGDLRPSPRRAAPPRGARSRAYASRVPRRPAGLVDERVDRGVPRVLEVRAAGERERRGRPRAGPARRAAARDARARAGAACRRAWPRPAPRACRGPRRRPSRPRRRAPDTRAPPRPVPGSAIGLRAARQALLRPHPAALQAGGGRRQLRPQPRADLVAQRVQVAPGGEDLVVGRLRSAKRIRRWSGSSDRSHASGGTRTPRSSASARVDVLEQGRAAAARGARAPPRRPRASARAAGAGPSAGTRSSAVSSSRRSAGTSHSKRSDRTVPSARSGTCAVTPSSGAPGSKR